MTITFGETFDKIREYFQEPEIQQEITQKLESVTIIRDVYGKVRLFLEPRQDIELEAEIQKLDICLSQKLGSYYGKDIWLPQGEQDGYKALVQVITDERIPAEWDDDTVLPRWYLLERHLAKQAWTNKDSGNPPWEQKYVDQGHKPPVVAFFSFKGGVGRSTALVATALTLSRHGHRVAIVDLDLEAPGLSTILSPNSLDNFGVIDYLLEKKVQKSEWSLRTHLLTINEQMLLGDAGETLRLLPAGSVDNNYLEKLARLDFQNLVDKELPETLREMLKELQSAAKPLDFILLDARAGFHDIGGLAIADLSHAAVIFATQSRQSWAGLKQVIRRLARPLATEQLPVVLVHAMAPPLIAPGREMELKLFRETAYEIFQNHYYSESETVPNSNDSDAPFTPLIVSWQDSLRGDIILFRQNQSQEESSRLSAIVNIMTNQPYEQIAEKLCRIFGRNLKKEDKV